MDRPNRFWGAGLRHGAIGLLLAVFVISIPRIEPLGLLGPMSDWANQISDMESVYWCHL